MSPRFPVADAHVDVLWRMEHEQLSFYGEASSLMAGYQKLLAGGIHTQVFALFTMPTASAGEQAESILRQIDLFYGQVAKSNKVQPVTSAADYLTAQGTGTVAAILSLEGGGCLHGQAELLRVYHRLGVRGLGLTWNLANELADGCLEPRGAGLTAQGRRVVEELGQLNMWVDLAHLADAGVRDVFKWSKGPVMASHANARAVHQHPRNLPDDVIRELVQRKGWIGLTFEASFLGPLTEVGVDDVCRHIDHMLELGAENHLGFGSDFDGTSHSVPGLENATHYEILGKLLADRYGVILAEKLLYQNFDSFLQSTLP